MHTPWWYQTQETPNILTIVCLTRLLFKVSYEQKDLISGNVSIEQNSYMHPSFAFRTEKIPKPFDFLEFCRNLTIHCFGVSLK